MRTLTLLALLLITTTALADTIYDQLKPGQNVLVVEADDKYKITYIKNSTAGHKIIAIAKDHIVLDDPSGTTRIWIPTTSIKSINVIDKK